MINIEDNPAHSLIRSHLVELQHIFELCAVELITQACTCPTTLDLSDTDSRLRDFVSLHHIDLSRKINYHVNTFQITAREKELREQLTSFAFTNEQVSS